MKKNNSKILMKASKTIVNAAIPGIDFPICPCFLGKPKTSQKLTSGDFKKLSAFLRSK